MEKSIVLGGGCFWCIEAYLEKLEGVKQIVSGYCGGTADTAVYSQVCSGTTDHIEVVEVTYDDEVLTLKDLLLFFFTVHDPTTYMRQKADVGPQYRSVVFYNNEEEHETIVGTIKIVEEKKIWEDKVVTEVLPAKEFFSAEEYHQNFFEKNPLHPYCTAVIVPHIERLETILSQPTLQSRQQD